MKLKSILFTLMAFLALSTINAQTLPKLLPADKDDGNVGSGGSGTGKSLEKPDISAIMNDPESIDIYFRTANTKIEVTITNDFGEVVYKQQVNTSNSPQLKINISALPTDHYKILCNNLLTGERKQFVFEIE